MTNTAATVPATTCSPKVIVAVDLKTGVRKWHFQQVHHGLWDHDNSSASLLIDATIDGRPRKLVAQPSKQGWLYVFDRITGQPIWPIDETPVPQTDVPGEWTAPTQPIPSKPPAYSRTFVSKDDVIDFTPQLRQHGARQPRPSTAGSRSPFVPPALVPNVGGKWLGADQHRQHRRRRELAGLGLRSGNGDLLHAGRQRRRHGGRAWAAKSSNSSASRTRKPARKPRWEADPEYGRFGTNQPGAAPPQAPPGGRGAGRGRGAEPRCGSAPAGAPGGGGGGRGGLTQGLDGLPIVKPPYGVISAIDLNTGTLKFQVPHGDTPDAIRNHPLLRGLNIPKTGQQGSVGIMVTKTLVVAGDPQLTAPPGRARGAMLRAYNKQTGEQVGEVLMPAPISGSPMTYSVDGRQYIIVAVSGGNYTGEYIAFALPQSELRPATGR